MLITTHCRSECEKSSQQWDARLRIISHPVWCRSSWHDELQKDAQSFPAQHRLMTDTITCTQSHTTSVMLTASQRNADWWLTQSPALSHTLPQCHAHSFPAQCRLMTDTITYTQSHTTTVSCSQLPSATQTDGWHNHLHSVTHYQCHAHSFPAQRRLMTDTITCIQSHMASRFNIYSQLVISTIRISDISNSNCWCQQFSIAVDINNSNCWYH